MNVIPARVAGVRRIAMVTPTPGGEINPLVLAAASIAGIEEIWRIGGAQAVAALAYGTDRIRPVNVITRSEEHTSELQSLMRISYAVFCLKKQNTLLNYTILTYYHNTHYTTSTTHHN